MSLGTGPPAKVDLARLAAAARFNPYIWEDRFSLDVILIFLLLVLRVLRESKGIKI